MSSGSIVGPNGKKYQPEGLCTLKRMAKRKIYFGYFFGSEGKSFFRFSTLNMNHQRKLKKVMVGNITNVPTMCAYLLKVISRSSGTSKVHDHLTQSLCKTPGTQKAHFKTKVGGI